MAMNQLVQVSSSSVGVILPMDELRDEGLVSGGKGGEPLEVADTMLRVERFDRGAWQVVRTDSHDFPAYMERPAFSEQAQPTVEA
jgi:hypothetical protein